VDLLLQIVLEGADAIEFIRRRKINHYGIQCVNVLLGLKDLATIAHLLRAPVVSTCMSAPLPPFNSAPVMAPASPLPRSTIVVFPRQCLQVFPPQYYEVLSPQDHHISPPRWLVCCWRGIVMTEVACLLFRLTKSQSVNAIVMYMYISHPHSHGSNPSHDRTDGKGDLYCVAHKKWIPSIPILRLA
jgi:hypothetical protein